MLDVSIVGDAVRTVERVTGRMTRGTAALAGAASGTWVGRFIGLPFLLFAVGTDWLWIRVPVVIIGTFWGAVFGFAAHWSTRGERDFSNVRSLTATRQVRIPRCRSRR